jgi:hypothetical protein
MTDKQRQADRDRHTETDRTNWEIERHTYIQAGRHEETETQIAASFPHVD